MAANKIILAIFVALMRKRATIFSNFEARLKRRPLETPWIISYAPGCASMCSTQDLLMLRRSYCCMAFPNSRPPSKPSPIS
jgi:hypothetical protein